MPDGGDEVPVEVTSEEVVVEVEVEVEPLSRCCDVEEVEVMPLVEVLVVMIKDEDEEMTTGWGVLLLGGGLLLFNTGSNPIKA